MNELSQRHKPPISELPVRNGSEPIDLSQVSFTYVEPSEPISRPGFVGALWGDVDRHQQSFTLNARGQANKVDVLGFQALVGDGAGIELHPENKQTEWTYILQGNMDMTIEEPDAHPVVSQMRGPLMPTVDLNRGIFTIGNDGLLQVAIDDETITILPTITHRGSSHKTQILSERCVYLAVKTSQ
ncbi:MAG: hypothetical protein V1922_06110 [bacterium]